MRMTRRDFLQSAAGVAAASSLDAGIGQTTRPPNLLYLFSDQHSSDMLGCYGNSQVISPNLDRLASGGIRFRHCISNAPVCSPYRGMLMSGLHPLYDGVFTNDVHILTNTSKHLAEVLRDAGYRTGYVGKWHLYGGDRNRPIPPGPDRLGFDDMFLSDNCTLKFGPQDSYYWNEKGEKTLYHEWQPYGQARQAINFLDTCTPDRPFTLFVSVHPPHNFGPEHYKTEPELLARYDPAKIKLRPNVEDTPTMRAWYQGYMGMVTGVDMAFGRILDKLQEKGLDQNTIVVFTADHGDLLMSHGRPWPKSFPESESCRIPFILRWPAQLRADAASDLLIGSLDLMPTLLGLMGMEIPRTCQGRDLSQAIRKGDSHATSSVPFFYFDPGWRGVYTHRYTYSFGEPGQQINWNVLYDREKDPYEETNLFASAAHQKVQRELHKLSLGWMKQFDDPFPSGSELMRLCFGLKAGDALMNVSKTGDLPGRPIDLLKAKRAQ